MNNVTLKNFQDKASSYLNQLPITLTRYGKPIADVVAHNSTRGSYVISSNIKEETEKNNFQKIEQPVQLAQQSTNQKFKVTDLYDPKTGRCQHSRYQGFCPICDNLLK